MKSVTTKTAALALISATSAYAAGGSGSGGTGIFTWLFALFAAMVITFQLIPAIACFAQVLKRLFSQESSKAALARHGGKR